MDFDLVRQIAKRLPEVEEAVTTRGWVLKVRGRLLACPAVHSSAEPGSLVVKVGFSERTRLLAEEREKFYVTDHYLPYPSILVRLSKSSRADMQAILRMAWGFVTATPERARPSAIPRRGARKRMA